MKTNVILLLLLLTGMGCTKNENAKIDSSKAAQVTQEVNNAVDQVFADWRKKDVNTSFALFMKEDDFTFITEDGSTLTYTQVKDMSKEAYNQWATVSIKILDKRVKLIDLNHAVALATYRANIAYKDGKTFTYPKVGCTFVMEKMDGQWMVTHVQESCLPPQIAQ